MAAAALDARMARRGELMASAVMMALSFATAGLAVLLVPRGAHTLVVLALMVYGIVMMPAAQWLTRRHVRWHAKQQEPLDVRLLLKNAALMWLAFAAWPVMAGLTPWAFGYG